MFSIFNFYLRYEGLQRKSKTRLGNLSQIRISHTGLTETEINPSLMPDSLNWSLIDFDVSPEVIEGDGVNAEADGPEDKAGQLLPGQLLPAV